MKRIVTSLFGTVILATTLGVTPLHAQQISSVLEKTTMSPYRELAERAYLAFQRTDYESAAKMARSLEIAWDSNAGFLAKKSPRAHKEIDSAMDAFIKPVLGYAKNLPDQRAVTATYEDYLMKLKQADEPWYGAGGDGDRILDEVMMPSGLVVLVTKHGAGRKLRPGDIAIVRATGVLSTGTEFRRTKSNSEAVFLQTGNKLPGLLEGLGHLRVGDSAILVLPPALGFGAGGGEGAERAIPPNSTLTYFVDVVDVKTKDMAELMQETIEEKGVDYAIEQYRELQKQGFPDTYSAESEINILGYGVLQNGNREGAIKIFKLNVEAYPESANVYDSFGEVYAANGEKQLAIENYRKALAIDPKMESSVQALKELQGN